MTGHTRTVKSYVIMCDGCGIEYGDGTTNEPGEIRGDAAAFGWELVPKLNRDGGPRKVNPNGRQVASGDDVCPDCAPNWAPRSYYTNSFPAAWLSDPVELRRRAAALEAEQTERAAAEAASATAVERANEYGRQAGPWPNHLKDEDGTPIAGERIEQVMTHPDIPDSRMTVTTEGSMEAHRRSGWQPLDEVTTS